MEHNSANVTCPGPGIKCACWDIARAKRRTELSKRSKAQLVIVASRAGIMGAHPLSSWRKDELVSSILDFEFRNF